MTQESSHSKTKVCPTCGTRLSENAVRCLVCGTEFTAQPQPKAVKKTERSVQAASLPQLTLSLPAAIGSLLAVIVVAAGLTFFLVPKDPESFSTQDTPTPTETSIPSASATATLPSTDTPTPTLQPPFDYVVSANDGSCSQIAFNFNVSVQSIIVLNNLASSCPISVGQALKIPYPTPTIPPPATNTALPAEATRISCETVQITVQENDTLSSIAANYAVSMDAVKEFNGLTTDNVFLGQTILIPLCERAPDPNKPTPTATLPPPYPAPNLLLPADGAAFTLANDVVTLQWASVGVLRGGEAYQVVVEDVTASQTRRITDYVTDTKYIIPTSFRPKDNVAHVMRWWVQPVLQSGVDDQGQPIWISSGATSERRVFTWVGVAVEGTPNP
ncbi:MAG: LysM peptidoglycan-binding domain-containing protein [Anaerolineales bacterium]|jgi:LysM repeat protein|uniref:muramidase family protein n=1 Tax=Candidatus Villigracilis vicinus TaxID=3140679 RepID=UPI00313764C8|nr:LysM peptidoglycan-binding domain-containing protein [Anaerolineales bacterium]MBK9781015.1 LysM peptidoglycan-binding domain-containing protein [Anaerolineales bacterium]